MHNSDLSDCIRKEAISDSDIVAQKVVLEIAKSKSPLKSEFDGIKVLAGLVGVVEEDLSKGRVISWATGAKSPYVGEISTTGSSLHDCHAEVLVRRGFLRFLYGELAKLAGGGESWLLQEAKEAGGYELKDGVSLRLYISTPPCGAGRIFESLGDEHEPLLSAKAEGTMGTVVVDAFDQGLHGLTSMSCTDKLTSWKFKGLQGTLLTKWLSKIPLDSLVIGSIFNRSWLDLCVNKRAETVSAHIFPEDFFGHPIKIEHTQIFPPENSSIDPPKFAPDFTLNWNSFDDAVEVVDNRNGRVFHTEDASRLSKRAMLSAFLFVDRLGLRARVPGVSSEEMYYAPLKQGLSDISAQFKRAISLTEFGSWLAEVRDFDFKVDQKIHHERLRQVFVDPISLHAGDVVELRPTPDFNKEAVLVRPPQRSKKMESTRRREKRCDDDGRYLNPYRLGHDAGSLAFYGSPLPWFWDEKGEYSAIAEHDVPDWGGGYDDLEDQVSNEFRAPEDLGGGYDDEAFADNNNNTKASAKSLKVPYSFPVCDDLGGGY